MLILGRQALEESPLAVAVGAVADVERLRLRDEDSKDRLEKGGVEVERDMDECKCAVLPKVRVFPNDKKAIQALPRHVFS